MARVTLRFICERFTFIIIMKSSVALRECQKTKGQLVSFGALNALKTMPAAS